MAELLETSDSMSYASLSTAPPRASIIPGQPLPLYHDPLVAYVDKHLELFNHLILLHNLGLQVLNLLLAVLFQLVQLFFCLAQLASEVCPDPLLWRWVRLAIYRGPVFRERRLDLLGVSVDRGPCIVYVAWEDSGVWVLFLQDLESLADPDTWTWLGQ